jgi:osmoprotectant transport system ATP-binding protein
LITFDEVSKRYPDGTVAVDNLSLELPTHKITVLVGPSGCGKTTSLRMINRMIEPTSGRVLWDGVDIATRRADQLRREMGYVIQSAGLFPHRTVLGNITTVPRLLGWERRRAKERALELMDRVGLPVSFAKRYPFQLSGGQQQRVGVARALAADPPVLLMDEPFSAVDPIVRKSLQEEFLRLQGELGKTIVFVTHDVDEAIKLGDRIAVMRVGGRLAQFASPPELLSRPVDEFVEDFLGLDRGIRRLSFFTAGSLPLRTDTVLPADATLSAARRAAADTGEPWLLLVDAARRPLGWLATDGLAAGEPDESLAGRPLVSIGHTFTRAQDSLRAALDAAVLSEAGRAVGVADDGAVLGTVDQERVATAIRAAHAAGEPVLVDTAAAEAASPEVTP